MPLLLRFLPAAGLLALALSCQQKPAETTAPPPPAAPAPPATSVATAPTVAQRFSPIISGYWVAAEYLDEVAHTRSPEAAFDSVASPSSLEIDSFASQMDSVEIGATYGLHEGGDLTLLLPIHATTSALQVKHRYGGEAGIADELTYRITATDTTLLYITRRSKTYEIVSTIAYRRTGMPGKKGDLEEGVERGINDLLITGRYSGVDSLNQPIRAQFFTNGIVKGLPFAKYSIQTDFTGPNPGNTISFDVYTKYQKSFIASFGRDTLKLYTIHSSTGVAAGQVDPNNVFSRGRLRYQLVRVKQP